MIEMTRDEMIKNLKNDVCRVVFVKSNGEERIMDCTLDFTRIPDEFKPKESKESKVNGDIIKVYEIDNGWRSFKVDSVVSFETWTDRTKWIIDLVNQADKLGFKVEETVNANM